MWSNQLFHGDNLNVLRLHVESESVDLVYLDPPFNKQASFNVLFKESSGEKSPSQIRAFGDSWQWGPESERTYEDVLQNGGTKLGDLLRAMRNFLGRNNVMAYLTMMAPRLAEMHRVLKSTGNLFLHCDPTSSHYLKLLLDAIFGPTNFCNEIVWRRAVSHNEANRFGRVHDNILFYRKSDAAYFAPQLLPLPAGHVRERFKFEDEDGTYKLENPTGAGVRTGDSGQAWHDFDPTPRDRHWAPPRKLCERLGIDNSLPTREKLEALFDAGFIKPPKKAGSIPMLKVYLQDDEDLGTPYQDLWAYQPYTQGYYYGELEGGIDQDVAWIGPTSGERLGFPTQKPLGLLARIITSACPPGGIVLDPFCGCGTAVAAAENLERRWIGIDITHLAVALIRHRLETSFGASLSAFEVKGEPEDLPGAYALAKADRYDFQWWALGKLGVRVTSDQRKKGADAGVDGRACFIDPSTKKEKDIIYSVKSGKVSVRDVRDLAGVLARENKAKESAPLGVLVTLLPPSKDMLKEAASAGFWTSWRGEKVQRIQIITIEEMLAGKRPEHPHIRVPAFRVPTKPARPRRGQQGKLFG